jgi:hypothetical protein
MSITLEQAIDRHGVDVLDYLDRTASIPMIGKAGRQGDVIVLARKGRKAATVAVPAAGFPVVRGENGGNTHLLIADGFVCFDPLPVSATALDLGTLTVAPGATAYLAHPEHGYIGITPGTYAVRRQREQADELRLVAD